MKRLLSVLASIIIGVTFSVAGSGEVVDTAMISKIKAEGEGNSRIMELISYLTDVYGPRLTGSPGCYRAQEWAKSKLESWGLVNARLEGYGPWGKGWELKRYHANVLGKQNWPLLSHPRAWSPGTDGRVTGDVVFFEASNDSALDTYRGKLKGKFVLVSPLREVKPHDKPAMVREADSSLLQLANAEPPMPYPPYKPSEEAKKAAQFSYRRLAMLNTEGVAAVLISGYNDGGVMQFVHSVNIPPPVDSAGARAPQGWQNDAPRVAPQVVVSVEHYQRLVRMIKKGERPRIEMELDAEFTDADSAYNVVAEIPGTDLKDEIVMIGGHIDSWHGSTGATDNATGVAACMEAVRILKSLNIQPRRTIRIGLWSGEEQGTFGSAAYVQRHLGTIHAGEGGKERVMLTPEGEKFSAYFNLDNGTGRIRGIYMEGNEALRPIFRTWLEPFGAMGASTVTVRGTGSTDHEPFNEIGLPGFQFIQDPYEYWSRSWHSTIDSYERVSEADVKQQAIIMAAFAYNAAMRSEKLPRKPAPGEHAGTN